MSAFIIDHDRTYITFVVIGVRRDASASRNRGTRAESLSLLGADLGPKIHNIDT